MENSVNMLMYRVQELSDKDLNILKDAHLDDIEYLCPQDDWEYKAYPSCEVDDNPARFAEILPFMKRITLKCSVTDKLQCYIAHGMPADTTEYTCVEHTWGHVLKWGKRKCSIPREAFERYKKPITGDFYVFKHHLVDIDVDFYTSEQMSKALSNQYACEMVGRPHHLTTLSTAIISQVLLAAYDDNELIVSNDSYATAMELLRSMVNPIDGTFIEFVEL